MVAARVTKLKEPVRRDAHVEYTERVDIDLTTFCSFTDDWRGSRAVGRALLRVRYDLLPFIEPNEQLQLTRTRTA